MNYYAAPMEGLTDRIWRQAHQRWFGAPEAPVRYYAPFLSPPENRVLIKKKMAELAPAANPGAPVIPQLLAKDGELAAWMIGELRALGYTEVNLNLGCPSGTVTAKGKGSGMLRDPAVLDAFLDAVFSHAEGPISVKTRLGVSSPDEFAAILDIYDRHPICELTIHPRVMRQLYRGQADRAAFAEALLKGDALIPDGASIVLAFKLLRHEKIERIAGWDLFQYEMKKLNAKGGTCFFLGSSEGTLQKIKAKAAGLYPNIWIETYSPPYKAEFSEEDNRRMIEAVNRVTPDLLWVGMTAPKQEKWAYRHWNELDIHCHCGTIGAVFDFFAGTMERAPLWWQEHSLEWLYRLLKEPKRMWRRYIIGNTLFIWNIFREM